MMFLKSITFWTLLIVHNTGAVTDTSADPVTSATAAPNATPAPTSTSATTQAPGALFGDPCVHDASNPKGNCTENAECLDGSCACVVGYVNTPHRHCKMAVGQKNCASHPNSCVDNAQCIPNNNMPNINECQCDSGYYAADNGTCEKRIPLGELCEPLASGNSPCVQPNATVCHNNTCDCNDDFHPKNNNICSPRLQVNAPCRYITDVTDMCVQNAFCSTENECKCNDTHYEDSTRHCQQRIVPGHACDQNVLDDKQCIHGALCNPSGVCECVGNQYRYKTDTCEKLSHPGEKCQHIQDCMDNTVCTNNLCACLIDHFYNSTIQHCQIRKPAGTACLASEECVENAACVDHRCLCDIHYYEHNQQCYPRERLGHQCDPSVPNQCLINGECVNELCQCNNKSYNNEDFSCPLTLGFHETCNWENKDPRQCVSNTTCIFRPMDSMPVCGCDRDHFFNGLHCIKRALAGESCPYYSTDSYGLHMPLEEFNNQCVEHAECNDRKVCECGSAYYDKAGHCPPRIQLNQICDPWRDYPHQCDGNAHCLYGRCV